ncbi:MAG: type II toxin-antitoxin system RelE/ParE family toxin [Verrucomicrobia bacterium]|nr:type II toxin-antitoxin system RelE/ParE family toxin [Verrucomicrobiota bacterium]
MTFEFLVPAQDEFEEAFDWYQARSVRAAEGFRARVAEAVAAAMSRPTSAGFLVGRRVRKILLSPYRYGLLYFVHEQVVYVVAVAHNRRRPNYWRRRITWI